MANIFSLPTLVFNERNIAKIIDVLYDITKYLKLTNKVIKSKMIFLKKDIIIISI